MKKYLDKLKRNIHINKNLFVFLLVIVIIGIISGSIFSIIISGEDKDLVLNYLNNFFTNIGVNKLNYNSSLINCLVFTLIFAILLWLLGISVIGFFIILFLLFLKTFILGFSVSCIIMNFNIKGVVYAFIYIFPHQIINILVFMLISAYGLIMSFKIMRCFNGRRVLDFKNLFKKYIIVLVVSLFVLTITCLYEIYIMPKVLHIIVDVLK